MTVYKYNGVGPTLADGVWIAPSATVLGDVHFGPGSSVWWSAVVRGDVFHIRVGARTNIQDGSVVHVTQGQNPTIIGSDVTIGHMALLHGCTVGDRSLIGMGSVLLDGCVIGEDCIIGAGSLVTPRSVIPPRTLALGRPARVVRPLTDAELASNLASAAHYAAIAARYQTDALTPVD